jgi:hypothetical protein
LGVADPEEGYDDDGVCGMPVKESGMPVIDVNLAGVLNIDIVGT